MQHALDNDEVCNRIGKISVYDPTELDRYFLPYIIFQDVDGCYLLLNREYKPVGMVPHSGEWVHYSDVSQRLRVRGLTPDVASKISVRGSPGTAWITLYDDSCRPWDSWKNRRAYLKRLKRFYDLVEIGNLVSVRATQGAEAAVLQAPPSTSAQLAQPQR